MADVLSQQTKDNELNDIVVTKYKAAAEIAKNALNAVIAAAVPGAKIIELNKIGDDYMIEAASKLYTKGKGKVEANMKGIAFPTCVNVGTALCHLHPLKDDPEASIELQEGQIARIGLSAHVDGYIAQTAHSFVVGSSSEAPATGREADVIQAAHTACEVVLRTLKAGNTTKQVTETVQTALKDFECVPVEGMVSGQIQRNKLEAGKQIVFQLADAQRKDAALTKETTFEVGEVYTLDMLITTGEGKPRKMETRVNIFKRDESVNYQLKMKSSRSTFSEISNKFGLMAFGMERFDEPTKGKMGLKECLSHSVVYGFEPLHEKPDALVAHFVLTIMLMPQGPLKLTSYPWDQSSVKSDKQVINSEIEELLKTSIRPKKAKK